MNSESIGWWGVVIGISVASVVAGLGQVIALEIASARGVRLGIPQNEAAASVAAH